MGESETITRRFHRLDGRVERDHVIEMQTADGDYEFWTVIDQNLDPDAVMEINSFDEAVPETVLVTLRRATSAEASLHLQGKRCAYSEPSRRRSWWARAFSPR